MEATAFAPGRVNLIGEHTDYNAGLALPFAIGQGVTVRARRNGGRQWIAYAQDLRETDAFDSPVQAATGWRAFPRGVVATLRERGYDLAPCEMWITGTVPQGSGLSSSAALEVSLSMALLALAGVNESTVDRMKLAGWCSTVENEWVGARAGLLDQLAVLFGTANHALKIDFQTLEIATVKCDLEGWRLVTLDSGSSHSNATSGYNQRREECEAACRELGIPSLREATLDQLSSLRSPLRQRAQHVFDENKRVLGAVAALRDRNWPHVALLLTQSHTSLRDLYECSNEAIEQTVRYMLDCGAEGARLIGGGFGGHVLGLFPPSAQPPQAAISVRPEGGARLM